MQLPAVQNSMGITPLSMTPVAVQNMTKGPLVFTDAPRGVEITFQDAGDPGGGDIQYVPRDIATGHPNFIRQLDLGNLRLVNADEDTQAAIARQRQFYGDRMRQQEEEALAAIDTASATPLMRFTVDEGEGDPTKAGKVNIIESTLDQ